MRGAGSGRWGAKEALKRFDRLTGPVLCRLSRPRVRGAAGRGALTREEVSRILILRPGGIGDAVLTLPMVREVGRFFDGAEIDLLAERRNAAVYRIADPERRVWCYDAAPVETLRRLRRRRYDLVIDTEQFHHLSTWLANLLAPRYLCGFDTLGRRRLQTHSVAYSEQTYEAESFLALAASVTGQVTRFDPEAPFLRPGRPWVEWADGALGSGPRPLAAIMVAAGAAHRRWPAERFGQVARWLRERGLDVLLVGGADGAEVARAVVDRLGGRGVTNLVGAVGLGCTAAALARCQVCVSPDTGILHVAYALGIPTVGLFGSGLQGKWGPPGRRHRGVNRGLGCSPCTSGGTPRSCPSGYACMDAIGVDDVVAALTAVLDREPV